MAGARDSIVRYIEAQASLYSTGNRLNPARPELAPVLRALAGDVAAKLDLPDPVAPAAPTEEHAA